MERARTHAAHLLLLLACCTGVRAAQPSTMDEAPTSVQAMCLGRYAFRLPAEAQLIGRIQWMNYARIEARATAPGETLETVATAIEKREREGDPYLPVTGVTHERIASDIIAVTVRKNPDHARVSAARLAGGAAFEAIHELGEAKWQLARETVVAIVKAISTDPNLSRTTGFCIDRGAVGLPFAWHEATEAGFDFGAGMKLFVHIHTNGKIVPVPLLRDAAAIQRRMHATGVRTQTLRARARSLAGIDGEELVIVNEDRPEALLQWLAVGKPVSGEHPSIRIRAEGRYPDREKLLASWDAILDSLRRR